MFFGPVRFLIRPVRFLCKNKVSRSAFSASGGLVSSTNI